MTEMAFQSALQLGAIIRNKSISAVEMLEYFIARVEQYDGGINAVVVRDFDRARENAKAADAALAKDQIWGPLHGVPVTLKESYDVEGLITTRGNPVWKDNVATADALSVILSGIEGVVSTDSGSIWYVNSHAPDGGEMRPPVRLHSSHASPQS